MCALNLSHLDDFPIKLLIYCNNNNYFGGGAGHFGGGEASTPQIL